MRVTSDEAREVAASLLLQAGTPREQALMQADLLIEAELRGHASHGLQRLPRLLARIGKSLIDPAASGVHHWRRDAMLEVDGQRGLGPAVALPALDALSARAEITGLAVAGVRNANHLGMLAYYVERVARKGQIAIALSTSEALVHPWGGTRAMLGTNPIAIGIPTGSAPFVLDLATSVVSMGKIHDHAMHGTPIPLGWARDAQGDPTTEPALAKSGAIAPFGEAKGYGLGLAVELLVASLAGSALAPQVRGTLDQEHVANKGDVFIVIDPPRHPGLANTIDAYLSDLRHSPRSDPDQAVSIPGDRAGRRRDLALRDGLDIEDHLWSRLLAASKTPHSFSAFQDARS